MILTMDVYSLVYSLGALYAIASSAAARLIYTNDKLISGWKADLDCSYHIHVRNPKGPQSWSL